MNALDRSTLPHGDNDGDLFHTIRAGLPGTQMPPFARLTDNEVWQLVTYVRSLSGLVPQDATSARSDHMQAKIPGMTQAQEHPTSTKAEHP